MINIHEPTFVMFGPPSRWKINEFLRAIDQVEPSTDHFLPDFSEFMSLLAKTHGKRDVYVLLDGLDGLPETISNVSGQQKILAEFMDWVCRRDIPGIFLKAFLFGELRPSAEEKYPDAKTVAIEWSRESLINLISRRFAAAMGITAKSSNMMGMVFIPDSHGLTGMLVDSVIEIYGRPNPREVLYLLTRVFAAHVQRCGPHGRLSKEDVLAGIVAYRLEIGQKRKQPPV